MTPKEKALELMQKYRSLDLNELSKSNNGVIVGITSKQCALIAVDEIMSQYKKPVVSHIVTAYKSAEDFNENFSDIERQLKDFTAYQILWWNSVKNEIELL